MTDPLRPVSRVGKTRSERNRSFTSTGVHGKYRHSEFTLPNGLRETCILPDLFTVDTTISTAQSRVEVKGF